MLHISCNIGTRDLPDMYALGPRALGIHIRQITRACVTTITYMHVYLVCTYVAMYGTCNHCIATYILYSRFYMRVNMLKQFKLNDT